MDEKRKFQWPILSDRYSTKDQLNYSDYCEVLRLAAEQAKTPISIGILGDWGSGKTSLMKMLERDLRANPNCIRIWFDAWKFTKEDVLWRAFLLRVIGDLRQALAKSGTLPEETKERFDQWEQRIYEALDLERMSELTVDWKKAASAGTSLVSSVIPFGSVLSGVVDKLTGAKATSEATQRLLKGDLHAAKDLLDLVRREKIEIHKRQLGFMEDFQKEFEHIITTYQTEHENARLVVFVDDLDRCLPEKAVQILEAIKLFLEVEGTVFVLGVAPEVVQRGIEVWYKIEPGKDSQEKGSQEPVFSGKKYLEKIIQLPFRLPVLEQHQFVDFIQKNCEGMPEFCDEIFGCGLEANPREAKRLLNIFGLQMALGEKRLGDDLHPPLLAKLNVIQERWTELYKHLVRYPAEIKTLEQACWEQMQKTGIQADQEHKAEETGKTASEKTYSPTIAKHAAYISLQEMMCCNRDQCSVQQIPFSVLQGHIHLTETTVATQVKSTDDLANPAIWQQLTGGGVEEQNEALEKLKELPEAEKSEWSSRFEEELGSKRIFDLVPLNRAKVFAAMAVVGDPRPEVLDAGRMTFCPAIEAGDFTLGDSQANDCPEHSCELAYAYRLATYPVTVAHYRQFTEDDGYQEERYWKEAAGAGFWRAGGEVKFLGDRDWRGGMPELPSRFDYANHPMVYTSWYESLAFCRWLTDHFRADEAVNKDIAKLIQDGWRFLLPSEAEWEKAARGSEGRRVYPCGNDIDANWANYSNTGIRATSAVGCFPEDESACHCFDMTGNVWEWCRNTYAKYPYTRDDREKVYEDVGSHRVIRGGSWRVSAGFCRCSSRHLYDPDYRYDFLGFRVVLVPSSVARGSERSELLQ